MKKILIPGAGGSPATNFVRSLRQAPENFHLIGLDCNKFYLMRAETDEKYLVPPANNENYIDVINSIIKKTGAEFMHIQNDAEMGFISENREKFNIKMFLPSKETIKTCLNKLESYKRWKEVGLKLPETILINDEDDLKVAFEKFNNKVWIRDPVGAGARGALPTDKFKIAKAWIDFKEGWGKYTVAEQLKPQSTTWLSIWKDGELIVAQGRKRIYWELGKIAPSGISGATGTGISVSDPVLDEIAQKAVLAISKKPNGIFAVDLTYDNNGIPNPTEINIGRFFTTHEFFTQAGLNMPYMLVKLAYNEEIPLIQKKINPLKENLAWIRGIDFLPILTDMSTINSYEDKLKERIVNLNKN